MWALASILFIVHHFISDPTCMWHGSLFQQLPNTQKEGFNFTHTKQKQKQQLKLKTPKTILKKPKKKISKKK
jgi:hypothetical protein